MTGEGVEKVREKPKRTEIGSTPVSVLGIWLLAIILLVLSVGLLYALAVFLPPATCPPDAPCGPTQSFSFFGASVSMSRETDLLLIVILAGALGALLHGLRSLAEYVGEKLLYRSWLLHYLSLPLIGAILAAIVYIVIRAGLIPGAGDSSSTNPYGFAAVGALVGLFSAQAAEKLKQVFETLFTKPDRGSQSTEDVKKKPPQEGEKPKGEGSPQGDDRTP